MHLESQIVAVRDLAPDVVDVLFALMQRHYDGVNRETFLADLAAKQWAILLRHQGAVCGFSTQTLFDHAVNARPIKVLFSGDTVIDKKYWGSLALPVAWGRLMLSLQAKYESTALYWLLTSKGYKTYRFLPVFFREFYPCHSMPTPPAVHTLLNSIACDRFGNRFDPHTGILKAMSSDQRLRPGVANIEARLDDPHVAYFNRRNPGHAQGDELVCLCRFHPDNLTSYIRRQL